MFVEWQQVSPCMINCFSENSFLNKQFQHNLWQLINIRHFIKTLFQIFVHLFCLLNDFRGLCAHLSFINRQNGLNHKFYYILTLLDTVIYYFFGHPGTKPNIWVPVREKLDDDHGYLINNPGISAEK